MKFSTAVIFMAALSILMSVMVVGQGDVQVYCGRHLASALATLCFNGLMLKRSDPVFSLNALKYEDQRYTWPWIPAHQAKSLTRGKRQGAASECCEKPCSIDELMTYCA